MHFDIGKHLSVGRSAGVCLRNRYDQRSDRSCMQIINSYRFFGRDAETGKKEVQDVFKCQISKSGYTIYKYLDLDLDLENRSYLELNEEKYEEFIKNIMGVVEKFIKCAENYISKQSAS